MVPETPSVTDRTFCHFRPFFWTFNPLTTWKIKSSKKSKKTPRDIIILHMCIINDNHMMYCYWDMEHDVTQFFVILDHFFALLPPNNLKNQNFKKVKKPPGDLSLYTCVP